MQPLAPRTAAWGRWCCRAAEVVLALALAFGPLAGCSRSAVGVGFPERSAAAGVVAPAAPPPDAPGPGSFRALMDTSMHTMHQGMNIPYTDSPDRDFAAMMIPHHQGAVEMARIELRFGRDERLRRLAAGIIVEQEQEIRVMQQILASLPPPQPAVQPGHSHPEP